MTTSPKNQTVETILKAADHTLIKMEEPLSTNQKHVLIATFSVFMEHYEKEIMDATVKIASSYANALLNGYSPEKEDAQRITDQANDVEGKEQVR